MYRQSSSIARTPRKRVHFQRLRSLSRLSLVCVVKYLPPDRASEALKGHGTRHMLAKPGPQTSKSGGFFFLEFGVYCQQLMLQDIIATSMGEGLRYCAIK